MMSALYINGIDAFKAYGVTLDVSALSALMTPSSKKEWITNEVRDENGTRYLSTTPMNKEREITINFQITAPNEQVFFQRYANLCAVFNNGIVDIITKYQPTIEYHCVYDSCSQFSQFRQRYALFTLKLIEPNPNNRTLTHSI